MFWVKIKQTCSAHIESHSVHFLHSAISLAKHNALFIIIQLYFLTFMTIIILINSQHYLDTSTYFADELRDMLHVGNLTSLTIIEAGGFGLQSLHTVLHLDYQKYLLFIASARIY